jgi:hypothetical protein
MECKARKEINIDVLFSVTKQTACSNSKESLLFIGEEL